MKRKSSLSNDPSLLKFVLQQNSLFEVHGAGILMRNEKFIRSHPSRSLPSLLDQQASKTGWLVALFSRVGATEPPCHWLVSGLHWPRKFCAQCKLWWGTRRVPGVDGGVHAGVSSPLSGRQLGPNTS